MTIELISGCTLDSIKIDGIEERELTDEKRIDVINAMAKHIKPCDLSTLIPMFMELYGTYESLGVCQCCGDEIDKWTLEL